MMDSKISASSIGISSPGVAPNPQPNLNSGLIDKAADNFEALLKGKLDSTAKPENSSSVKFSNHAIERMRSRGIGFNAEDMGKLNEAVAKAEQKGSKETLVLYKDSAFIVNVKNKTVVTAMDQNMMKENVFTNIDSTILI